MAQDDPDDVEIAPREIVRLIDTGEAENHPRIIRYPRSCSVYSRNPASLTAGAITYFYSDKCFNDDGTVNRECEDGVWNASIVFGIITDGEKSIGKHTYLTFSWNTNKPMSWPPSRPFQAEEFCSTKNPNVMVTCLRNGNPRPKKKNQQTGSSSTITVPRITNRPIAPPSNHEAQPKNQEEDEVQ